MRSARWLSVAAALPLLLGACAGIPTSGPVQRGADLRIEPENPGVPFIAEPPARGASARDVVLGFLRASADFRGDHEKARLYLSPDARQKWDPSVATTVYDSVEAPDEAAPEGIVVHAAQVGQIDAEGSFRRTPEGSTVERTFAMSRVDGEWRISRLEDGLLLSTVDVRETYRQVALYFLSPSRNTLVPDLVLVPQLPGLTTQLISRLLEGPTSSLRGAVGSAFPPGTDLDVQSVPVRDGLATVRLDDTALRANDTARGQMSAQIVWTLKQLGPEIARVRITAGGEDLVTSGVNAEQPRDSWGAFDPDVLAGDPSVYLVRDGAVGRIIDGDFGPVAGPAGGGDPAVRTPAVSLDGTRLAAVTADGTRLLTGRAAADAPFAEAASGGDLSRPSFDPLGNLWFADRATGVVWLLPAGGTAPVEVTLPKLPAGPPGRVAVSRDGSRVAMVVGSGTRARMVVGALAGVELVDGGSVDGGEVAVTAVREPLPDVRSVRDVVWADATTLVVLGSTDELPVAPTYVSTDGYRVRDVEAQARLESVAAAPQASPLVGGTRDRLWQFTDGRGWVPLGQGSDPAYPG